ncbi:MAG: hypothetical protein JNM07_06970 [Phycisphaerae bacterium]|nr:hypothetical protein [Phycisphaerae bacterium]
MDRRRTERFFFPALLLTVVGQPVGLGRAELPAASAPQSPSAVPPSPLPAPPPSPAPPAAAPTGAPSSAADKIAFTFKDTPWSGVVDFLARQTGIPVIKEAELPPTPVTYISGREYTLDEAIDVLNRMLWMHGLQIRRQSNYLFVTKLEDAKAVSEQFIGKVPDTVGDATMVTVVVPLSNAQAGPLTEQIKPLMSKFGGLTALVQQNALVLVDSAAQVRRLRGIIDEVDAKPLTEQEFKLFPLRFAQSDVVLGALRGLMAEKRTTVIVDPNGQTRQVQDTNTPGLNIQADARTNSIVAVGPGSKLRVLEQVVAMLDKPEGEVGVREMMTFQLRGVTAEEAARQLGALYAKDPERVKPTILPIAAQSKIAVVGGVGQLAAAAQLVAEIDPGSLSGPGAPPAVALPEDRAVVIPLKHAAPQGAIGVLSRLLSPRQTALVRYAATPDGKGLIVTGPAAEVAQVQQLLAGLDAPSDTDREVRLVRVAQGDAAGVVARAKELYAMSTRAQTDKVEATLDAASRTVTLVGTRAGLTAFSELLSSAQSTGRIDQEARTFALARAKASEVAPKLTRMASAMLQPTDGSQFVPPQIDAVDEIRSIVVRAPAAQMAVIEQLVRSIDRPSPGSANVRVVKLQQGDVRAITEKALTIYKQQTEGLPEDQAGPVLAEADQASSSVLISAGAAGMEKFTSILSTVQQLAPATPTARLIELRVAKAEELAAFLKEFIASSRPFQTQPGPDPVFEPIPATNSILAAGSPAQLAVIEQLARAMDTKQSPDMPPIRMLKLTTTDAANIAQVLGAQFNARPADQRLKLPVEIQADPGTNMLIVSAHASVYPEIEKIVEQLNQTQAVTTAGREIRIYPLKVARAEELARTIDQMYPDPPVPLDPRTRQPRPDLKPAREVVVRADRGTNSLIVDAPVQRLTGFEALVKQLDQQKIADNVQVRTYRVYRAELSAVATTLRNLSAGGSLGVPAGSASSVTIDTEPASRTLIVSGPADVFVGVERVLKELDSPSDRPATALRMYALRHARAERLQPLLQRLLVSRLKEQKDAQGLAVGDVQSLLEVAAESATNTLLISGPEFIQKLAEELVKSLDSPAAATGRIVVRVSPLSFADPAQTAATLNQTLAAMELPSGGRVQVSAAPGSGALILSGAEADLDRVEELLKALDVKPPGEDKADVVTVSLKQADAATIAPIVERLLVDQQANDPRFLSLALRQSRGMLTRVPQVRVQADPRTNSLIVSGPSATMALAKTIVQQLDMPAGASDRETRVFTPAKGEPARLIATIRPLVDATVAPGRKPMEMIAEPTSGGIVVVGSADQVARAVALLAEFDDRSPAAPRVDVQMINLRDAEATGVARAVAPLLADRSRWPEDLRRAEKAGLPVAAPAVNADAAGNRVLVSAPSELMPLARQLVATFDVPPSGRNSEVRIFALTKSEPDSVAAGLRTALAANPRAGEAAPVVTAVPVSRSVVVSASPERLERAAEYVRSLDESASPDGMSVRTVYLKHARAESVTPLVEQLLNRQSVLELLPQWQRAQYMANSAKDMQNQVRIAAERRLNAIVLSGPVAVLDAAEQIVSQLDVDPEQAGTIANRAVRLIQLSNADVAETAASITAMFTDEQTGDPVPTIKVDRGSNSLLVRATPAQMAAITELVEKLDKATLATSREMRLVPLDRSRADAKTIAETIQRLLEQRSGVKVEVISSDELLRTTGESGKGKTSAKPAPRRSAPAKEDRPKPSEDPNRPDVQPSSTTDDPPKPDPGGGGARAPHRRSAEESTASGTGWRAWLLATSFAPIEPPAAEAGSKGAPPPVLIAVDPASNSLIVVGSPRLIDRVATLASELERQMPREPGKIRVVTMPEAVDARSVSQFVNSAITQIGASSAANPGGFTGRVSVQPDPEGGALIVSANDTDFEVLADLIGSMTRPGGTAKLVVKVYPLSNTTAAGVTRAIVDLLSAEPRGRQARRLRSLDLTIPDESGELRSFKMVDPSTVRATADPAGSSIVVAAPADAIPLLDRFISLLDQSPLSDRPATRLFELKNAKAADASKLVQGALDAARQPGAGPATPQARTAADDRTNSVLVTGSSQQLREADRLLTALDAPAAEDGAELAIIPLQVARPSTVQRVVEAALVGKDPARREKIQFVSTDESSLFVIRALPGLIEQARKVIAEVDRSETTGLPIRNLTLERADADDVAQTLRQFFDERARASQRPGARAAGVAGARAVAIVADARSGTLVVAASDEDYEQIRSLASIFDAPEASKDVRLKVIPLGSARVGEIRPTIEGLVAGMKAPPFTTRRGGRPGGAPSSDAVVVEFDERSNAVLLIGKGEMFDAAERIVAALDSPAPAEAALTVRARRLEHADPRTVASAVTGAMASRSWRASRGVDPDAVRVEVDAKNRTLMFVGRGDRVEQALAYCSQLDTAAAADSRIESISLRFAAADRVSTSLERFFRDRAGSGQGETGVSLIGSRDGNVIIASAGEADLRIVRQLVAEMDQPDDGEGRSRELFHLRNADAAELAATLREQFPRSLSQREGLVIVTPQASTNSVIVSAPAELFERVSALVTELDAPPTDKDTRIVTIALAQARAEEAAQAITQALPKGIKIKITPVRRTNSLLLTGSDESVALVSEQITKLDAQSARNPLEFRRVRLEHAVASDVASTLREVFRRNPPAVPGEPQAAVTVSTTDNTLQISATTEQFELVRRVIAELDVATSAQRTTEFVPLRFAKAEATSEALSYFFGRFAPEATSPTAKAVTIVANPPSNSLVISAEKDEWPRIRALLEKLDNEEYNTARRLEIVALKHADATSLARSLQEAFAAPLRAEIERERARQQSQRARGQGELFDVPRVLVDDKDAVSVTAESVTNSLIVSAGREDAERIKAVVAQLDVPEFARLPQAHLIPLRVGPASQVAGALRQLFTDGRGGAGATRGPRSVVIVGEDRSNTLIVRAEEADYAQIKVLADTLQQEGDRSRAAVRVLKLKGTLAARLAGTLRSTFEPVAKQAGETLAMEIDRTANALVIASSERLYEEIRKTVEELDRVPVLNGPAAESAPGLGQSVFIVDLEHNAPADIARTLEQMGVTRQQPADRPGLVAEPVSIVALTSRRAVAVVASSTDGQVVTGIVRSLDAAPAFPEQTVAIIRLKTATAQAMSLQLESMLKPAQQDAETPPARALAEQVRRLKIRRDAVGGVGDTIVLDLTKPIRVFPEPQTNAVFISSTPDNVAAMSEIVNALDKLPVGDAITVRFFPLQNAAAQRLATVVRELFTQGERLRTNPGTNIRSEPTSEVGKALIGSVAISVDDRTNALIVAGREEAVALVEVLVRQMDTDRVAAWIEPRIIRLKHADSVRLARTLNQALVQGLRETPEMTALQRQVARIRVMLEQRDAPKDPVAPSAKNRIDADLFAPLSSLAIIPEEQLNALLIVGSPSNAAAIEELVRLLDVPAAAAANTVRVFPLQFAAAERVSGIVREIFRQQIARGVLRPEDDAAIVPDTRTNSLVITTSPRSFQIIESLLSKLDGEGMNPSVGLHVVPVPNADVTLLSPKIQTLMRERIEAETRAGGAPNPRDAFSIQPDPATGSLIVSASDENLQVVKGLVEVLTRGAQALKADEVVDVIPVQSSRVEQMALAVRQLYVEKENARRGKESVRVAADQRLNALVVSGGASDVEAMRTLVRRLDSSPVTAVTEIKRMELKKADAAEVVRLLQNVLAGRGLGGGRPFGERQALLLRFAAEHALSDVATRTGREPTEAEISGSIQEQVTITAETRTNSVFVVAPARLMVLIEDLVQDLDATRAGARQIETFELKNADARAMAEVLRELFNLRQQGNTYVLVPERDVSPSPSGSGPATEPANAAAPTALFPTTDERQQLALTVDPRTNTLIVSGTEQYLEEVRKIVDKLDGKEVNERERLVFPLRNARAPEMARVLKEYFKDEADRIRLTLGPDKVGSLAAQLEREVTVQGDDKSNRLLVSVSPRYAEAVSKIVEELDATPPQVFIQVILAEVTLDTSKTFGIDFKVGPFGGESYIVKGSAADGGITTALGIPNYSVASQDFELLIRALEGQGRLEVLSRPTLLVNNNEAAKLQVGQNIGLVDGIQQYNTGNTRTDVKREDVGIIMNVQPSISNDGFVRLDISPEISQLSDKTTQISEGLQSSIINKRSVKTTVTVKDGETIVIGGLFQTSEEERKAKVPILGDIPIVGEVFKSSKFQTNKTELLVMLTPRVVRSGTPESVEQLRTISQEEVDRLSKSNSLRDQLLKERAQGRPESSPTPPGAEPVAPGNAIPAPPGSTPGQTPTDPRGVDAPHAGLVKAAQAGRATSTRVVELRDPPALLRNR